MGRNVLQHMSMTFILVSIPLNKFHTFTIDSSKQTVLIIIGNVLTKLNSIMLQGSNLMMDNVMGFTVFLTSDLGWIWITELLKIDRQCNIDTFNSITSPNYVSNLYSKLYIQAPKIIGEIKLLTFTLIAWSQEAYRVD